MANEIPNLNDPLAFVRSMWSGMGISMPGMVTPTLDVDELDKRIKDMKAVEGWLRMNLSMLQMTIQGLEMQVSTLSAVRAMGQMASESTHSASGAGSAPEAQAADGANPFAQAAMWPWSMMQQMQAQMQQEAATASTPEQSEQEATKAAVTKAKKQ